MALRDHEGTGRSLGNDQVIKDLERRLGRPLPRRRTQIEQTIGRSAKASIVSMLQMQQPNSSLLLFAKKRFRHNASIAFRLECNRRKHNKILERLALHPSMQATNISEMSFSAPTSKQLLAGARRFISINCSGFTVANTCLR